MYQTKKIEINESNVKIFTERYASKVSIQPFTNQLLEKYFSGRLVELDDQNYKIMNELSVKLKSTIQKTANSALEAVDWSFDESPKPRVLLDTNGKKVKPIKKFKNQINIIKDF